MLGFLAPLAGEALKQGVSQSPSSGPATAKADNWFSAGGDFTANTGGSSPLVTAAAIGALVIVLVVVMKKL